jgi:hypothetical protein
MTLMPSLGQAKSSRRVSSTTRRAFCAPALVIAPQCHSCKIVWTLVKRKEPPAAATASEP